MERIEEIKRAWKTKREGEPELWYRGLQKSSWTLIPTLYRPDKKSTLLLKAGSAELGVVGPTLECQGKPG